jgi:hypothetical protein
MDLGTAGYAMEEDPHFRPGMYAVELVEQVKRTVYVNAQVAEDLEWEASGLWSGALWVDDIEESVERYITYVPVTHADSC